MTRIGPSDLDVFPLCLGGNVFGWTADEAAAFAILDAYAAAGGNFIDTADAYPAWAHDGAGGASEAIIGRWLASRGNRDRMVIATKVGKDAAARGLTAASIRRGAEASLRRLGVDCIDLYYAHYDDEETPLLETLGAFDALVREGKVRAIAASNYGADRLASALDLSARHGLAAFVALQPNYNLVHREEFEGPLADVVRANGLGTVPYYGLASGFLTGKYRQGATVASRRAASASRHGDARGQAVLAALDEVAAARGVAVATVALAWLRQQPTVVAPIASARTVAQVPDLVAAARCELTAHELATLDAASAQRPAVR